MHQAGEFFQRLLDTSDWPPRWVCGTWTDFHGWLYIGSDLAIWLAYFIIPVILIWFIQRRPDVPFLPVFWLFGAFIILCGMTHLVDAAIFWWPAYRLSALVRFITAVVSFITVFALIRNLPKALNLQGPDSLRRLQDKHEVVEEQLRAARAEAEVVSRRMAERNSRIAALTEELHRLRIESS